MATPVPFLTSDDTGKYVVHEEAAKVLEAIEGPIAVVAVAGLYRTGKSFLLNSLLGLNGQPESFVVGNTVNACTKGLWLWGAPVKLEGGLTVLFVDSEGLGSTSRTATEDCQIFSLALLLSSHFIWNSRGTIDGNAIEDFGLVVNLSKSIHMTNKNNSGAGVKQLAEVFPSFMWVVRDFTLRLERNGQSIEDREYLEEALKPTTAVGEQTSSRDEIRKLLKGFFKARDCCTLVRPAEDEAVLRNLNAQPLSALRPEFVKALDSLKKKVFGSLRPKMLNGQVVTGTMLTSLARSYTDALNSGGVPTIATAWDRVLSSQAEESVGKAIALYGKLVAEAAGLSVEVVSLSSAATPNNKLLTPCALPLEPSAVDQVHADAFSAAVDFLQGNSRGPGGQSGDKLPLLPSTTTVAAIVSPANLARLSTGAAATREAFDKLNYQYSWEACSALAQKMFGTPLDELGSASSGSDLALMGGGGDNDSEHEEFGVNSVEKMFMASTEQLNQKDEFGTVLASKVSELETLYHKDAKGPAKYQVITLVLASRVPACAEKRLQASVAAEKVLVTKLRAELAHDAMKAERVRAKLAAEKDVAGKEALSLSRALEDAQKAGLGECAVESARLEVKKEELVRVKVDLERLETAYDHCLRELAVMLEGDERLVKDLHGTYMQLQEEQQQQQGLFSSSLSAPPSRFWSSSSSSPAAAAAAEGSSSALRFEQVSSQITVERREVDLLSSHAGLLQENITATKELAVVKEAEVQEREFQWGMAKANVAHEEGEAMTLEEDTSVLRSLAVKLRANLLNRLTNSLPGDLLKALSAEQVAMLQAAQTTESGM